MVPRDTKTQDCIDGLVQAINNYCMRKQCPTARELKDVEGIMIVTFGKDGHGHAYLNGYVDMGAVVKLALNEMARKMHEETEDEQIANA